MVTFSLPPQVESGLRERYADLNAAAKEAMLLELYRREELSHRELAEALGLDRAATEALLAKHHIYAQTLTFEQFQADLRALAKLPDQPAQ